MAQVVDVVDQQVEGTQVIQSVLQKVASGVPLWNRPMEYVAQPAKSPLRSCGVPELEQEEPSQQLVEVLRGAGIGEDSAEVGAAVLCLALGGLDEAHNLVTPHSWAAPTTFGGQPKPQSSARSDAIYCQALVHRMEGTHIGEFGTGFNNSNFWLRKAFPGRTHAIFPALRDAAGQLDGGEARALLRTMGPQWDPWAFNHYCQEALEFEESESLEFCERLQAQELRLLFEHVTQGAFR